MNSSLHNPDAERSVLGAILLDERHLTTLMVDEHLLPDHFGDPGHATIYRAALDLQNAGHAIDYLTVAARLRDMGNLETAGGEDTLERLTSWVPAAGHVRDYGRLVRERHQARGLLAVAKQIEADVLGCHAPIDEVIEAAAERVATVAGDDRHGRGQHAWTPDQLRDLMLDDLAATGDEVWHTPFPVLDELLGGGMTRGELMLIAAEEKVGKSHLIDQFLETWAAVGLRARLYINEGGKTLRLRRHITRATGIPTRALKARDLTDDQMRRAISALHDIRVGITDCTGWTAREIVRDIKRNRWDVCGVDILHNISKTEAGVEGWDQIGHELRLAPAQADCVMVVAAHLKKRNSTAGKGLDIPVPDDIRDSGMFAKLADQVLFIARERDEQGILTSDGVLALSALRDGEPGLVKVTFQVSRLRFLPALAAVSGLGVRADQYRPRADPDVRTQSQGYALNEAGF